MDQDFAAKSAEHLQSMLNSYHEKAAENPQGYCLTGPDAIGFITRCLAAIPKITGEQSAYSQKMRQVIEWHSHDSYKADVLYAVLEALLQDVEGGFLLSVTEMVHAEVFEDFLDMASYLLEEGYKDAAAVMAGGTLESHLRQLCIKHGIPVETSASGRPPQPKKASQMNQDLGNKIYSLYDQKMITAWLDLRNNAAHGKYDQYSSHLVSLMIDGIRDFIARNPA